jgi:hypothetical protein
MNVMEIPLVVLVSIDIEVRTLRGSARRLRVVTADVDRAVVVMAVLLHRFAVSASSASRQHVEHQRSPVM